MIVPFAALGAYLRRAETLRRRGRPVPAARQVSFAAGVAVVLVALASPVAHLGEELFVIHVAQHLLLADIGALLLVLGLTGPVLAPLLRIRLVDRLRVLAHPAAAMPLWAVNLYLWHLPPLQDGVLESDALHALMHGSFLATGALVWMPLFGPLPKPDWFGDLAKLLYIVGVRFSGALLANVFLWGGAPFYPGYAAGEASWGIQPLRDQGGAGAAMLVEESILTICLFGWIFIEAARHGEETQRLLELAESRGVRLAEKRVR
ncbi:MAG: cytochrome c oxidase assembly protein, partial [Thermoleophilaceae bacterium]